MLAEKWMGMMWLWLVVSACSVEGIQFYLHAGKQQCFTEDLEGEMTARGEFMVATGEGDMPVDLIVRTQVAI